MEPLWVNTIICPRCGAELDAAASRCNQCGSPAGADEPGDEHRSPEGSRSASLQKLIDNPWAILGFLFGAALVLGLPFLWKSRGFSPLGKAVLTVVVTLYTALVFWLFWLVVSWSWARVAGSLGW